MPQYLTGERIKKCVEELADTRAKGSLFDFLVIKRTLKLKGAKSVALSLAEGAYTNAVRELASVHATYEDKAPKQFFNVLQSDDSKGGFRSGKYASNGPGTTVNSNPWQTIVEFSGTKPRQVGLKASYETNLERALLKAAHEAKPRLSEIAIWVYRRADVHDVISASADPKRRAELLSQKLIAELDLTPGELGVLFDQSIGEGILDGHVQTEPADAAAYLDLSGPQEPTATEPSGKLCSLDLVVALAAKPFVIITGSSGTGKSRSTLTLAEQLQELYDGQVDANIFQLVPVGPDWTSPKRLLGFRTPFGQARLGADGKETNESYEITDALRIILRACNPSSTAIPHFLLFDEMNLSHVERYFAPFLSLMEASSIVEDGDNAAIIDDRSLEVISELLQLEDPNSSEAKSAKTLVANGQRLRLPPNLFYVGTVNVDETTYMFSPKVLDRAHVLEVKALKPSEYVAGASLGATIDLAHANQLLREAIDERESDDARSSDPSKVLDSLVSKHGVTQASLDHAKSLTLNVLEGCFKLLAPVGFEFAFRINKEVYAYMLVWTKALIATGVTPEDAMTRWVQGLDRALFQKVLPKIHGNRSALGDSLKALAVFLKGLDEEAGAEPPTTVRAAEAGARYSVDAEPPTTILKLPTDSEFTQCVLKLTEMHARLISRNYVSFVK